MANEPTSKRNHSQADAGLSSCPSHMHLPAFFRRLYKRRATETSQPISIPPVTPAIVSSASTSAPVPPAEPENTQKVETAKKGEATAGGETQGKSNRCYRGLALLAAFSTLLILLVFNPLDEVLERGHYLAEYRAQALKTVVVGRKEDRPNAYQARLNFLAKEDQALENAIADQLDRRGRFDVVEIMKFLGFSFAHFVTSPSHPIYQPLRLLILTVLLLSIVGLLFALISRFGLKVLNPCEIFNGLTPPSPAGEGKDRPAAASGGGSAANTVAKTLLAGILIGPPMVMAWVHGAGGIMKAPWIDTASVTSALDKLNRTIERANEVIGGKKGEKSTGENKSEISANLVGALQNQHLTVDKEVNHKLAWENPNNLIPIHLFGWPSQPSAVSDASHLAGPLWWIGNAIYSQHGALTQIGSQISELNQNLDANNKLLGATAFGMRNLQTHAVMPNSPGYGAAENMRMLCGQLRLYQSDFYSKRREEIVADFFGSGQANNTQLIANVSDLCCQIDSNTCAKTPVISSPTNPPKE